MRGGCSGEATTLWLSLQLCALSVSESAVARVGSTPRAGFLFMDFAVSRRLYEVLHKKNKSLFEFQHDV